MLLLVLPDEWIPSAEPKLQVQLTSFLGGRGKQSTPNIFVIIKSLAKKRPCLKDLNVKAQQVSFMKQKLLVPQGLHIMKKR
ncbi:unnamed protein product [Litomosoides sigmodontis]|uniref:Uncharacterized protein n=1 Tax=Litomosoides sigmodontis TaxID=42156 RepID=A0A3P6TQU8_LITSI|nr:unnamed protein product [Litomosoides sigmodontis]